MWTAGGCRSYYLDAEGRNVAVWPGSSWSFRSALRRFDAGASRFGTPAPRRPVPTAPPVASATAPA